MSQDYQKPKYPALNFLLRYGMAISVVAEVVPLLAAIWLVFAGGNIVFAVVGVVAAGFVYLIMRSYVELVAVIADMLLPK